MYNKLKSPYTVHSYRGYVDLELPETYKCENEKI
jgi:hypothetical protein